jgi:hypothetical protein
MEPANLLDPSNNNANQPSALNSSMINANVSSPSKRSPGPGGADPLLIQYVQEAIQYIKAQRQQCNVKSIFAHLRHHHSDFNKVVTLTERELMHQLELGVKDGILSRKFGSAAPTGTAPAAFKTVSSGGSSTPVSPVKSMRSTNSSNNLQSSAEIKLPNLDQAVAEKDKRDLNLILQLLMKAIATLTKQIFADRRQSLGSKLSPKTTASNTEEPCWCTVHDICTHLMQHNRFKLSENCVNGDVPVLPQIIFENLSRIILHLANKHEKIFLKESINGDNSINQSLLSAENCKLRLNSVYIQEKLHAASQQATAASATSIAFPPPALPPPVQIPSSSAQSIVNKEIFMDTTTSAPPTSTTTSESSSNIKLVELAETTQISTKPIVKESPKTSPQKKSSPVKVFQNEAEKAIEQAPNKKAEQEVKKEEETSTKSSSSSNGAAAVVVVAEASITSRNLTVECVARVLGFTPPYTPAQVLEIERVKKPTVSSPNKKSDKSSDGGGLCSFCMRPEKSNPSGIFDRFLTCSDCGSHGHAQCLNYSRALVDFIRDREIKWQCIECKKCNVCLSTCEGILLCDRCDRGYHKECCQPPFTKPPKGSFNCHVCKFQIELSRASTVSNTSVVEDAPSNDKAKKKRKLTNLNSSKLSNAASLTNPPKIEPKGESKKQGNLKVFFKLKIGKTNWTNLFEQLDNFGTCHISCKENKLKS